MPHLDSDIVVQHVTFRLADSLPAQAIRRLEERLKALPADQQPIERRKRLEELMDAGHGSCLLREPHHAGILQDALLRFDGERYRLCAWVVMPNHVHVLLQTLPGHELGKVVWSWKSFTGRRIRENLRQAGAWRFQDGPVWFREYWDRFVRDRKHYDAVVRYIHDNPVRAGLAGAAIEWRWSSAYAME